MSMNFYSDPAQEATDAVMEGYKAKQSYEMARARRMAAQAEDAELDLAVKRGDLVSRTAFQQASVVAMAVLAQTLNSIPDQMERRCGLTPSQAGELAKGISEALAAASEAFKEMAK